MTSNQLAKSGQSVLGDSHHSNSTRSKTSDHRKQLIMATMASRLTFLGDPDMQRQELALAIETLAPLSDDLLKYACVVATQKAGNRFVLAQHIYDAARPRLRHQTHMARISAEQSRRMIEPPKKERASPEVVRQIMKENGYAK